SIGKHLHRDMTPRDRKTGRGGKTLERQRMLWCRLSSLRFRKAGWKACTTRVFGNQLCSKDELAEILVLHNLGQPLPHVIGGDPHAFVRQLRRVEADGFKYFFQ